MKIYSTLLFAGICYAGICTAQDKAKNTTVPIAPTSDTAKKKPVSPLMEKTKSSRKAEGLFTLYQDTANGSVQLYVKKGQLGKEYIYQSFSLNGPTALYLNQSMHRANFIIRVQKSFDKLEISRVNTAFYYDPTNPVSRTKDVDKPDAVLLVERISAEDADGYLIPADALFLGEKLDPVKPVTPPAFFGAPVFSLGNLNPMKSKYSSVKSFPENTDIVVDLAYDNPNAFVSGGPDITDARYVRVRMQHTFIELPDNGFLPRRDDPRVGYFTQQVTDQTSISPTPYRDMINRWHLVKKDPAAALSEPVTPIIYWIENTTPHEYRSIIMEAGLKWNRAFEKAGFRNAVVMKVMPDDASWDPADIRYNVIRWVSSANPQYGAIGPSFVNPKTGQILGADITVEWFTGSITPVFDELLAGNSAASASPAIPGLPAANAVCHAAHELKAQLLAGATTLDIAGAPPAEMREMHKQFLTYLIMHEMGHTFGLNHNMKASQLWSPAEINNKKLTREFGLTGSVMDYPAINIALDKQQQGDYYTTIGGPYDDWAIEYGYRPFARSEEAAQLAKILSRSNDPRLAFGNDGDLMQSPGRAMDPRVNVNDMSSDAVGYAAGRFQLVNKLMGKIVQQYSREGQSFAELRARYNVLQSQRYSMIAAVSRYVGGIYIDRSFPEQHSGHKPYTPVPVAEQKRAMRMLNRYVFAPDAFEADAVVYPYLQPQRRGFSQGFAGDDYKVTNAALNQQINGALLQLLHPSTLLRITNSRLYGNQYPVADMMKDLSDGIFAADLKTHVNVYRQNLQAAYVKMLLDIVADKFNQYDDIATAAALHSLRKIKTSLAGAVSLNEETRAHRAHLVYLIANGLEPR